MREIEQCCADVPRAGLRTFTATAFAAATPAAGGRAFAAVADR
ncbi:MAG TPA: hypothetical protein VGC67_09725 [Cellulomonas sp.]